MLSVPSLPLAHCYRSVNFFVNSRPWQYRPLDMESGGIDEERMEQMRKEHDNEMLGEKCGMQGYQ